MEESEYFCNFVRLRPLLLKKALSYVKDPFYAEDLVEETLLSGHKYLSGFRKGSLEQWLSRIMRRLFFRACNLEDKRKEALNEVLLDKADYFYDGVYPFDDYEYVMSLAEELPQKLQTVFILCRLKGYSLDQISQALWLPIGTVKSRLSKADELIRKALKENLY